MRVAVINQPFIDSGFLVNACSGVHGGRGGVGRFVVDELEGDVGCGSLPFASHRFCFVA